MVQRREGISPKDFAAAIGVSESSIKRWVDQGLLRAVRTAGGHRRIAPDEAQRWIREHRVTPVRPERLGLEPSTDAATGLSAHVETFYNHLFQGRAQEARSLGLRLFLGGHSVAAIGDELVSPAMVRLGTLWEGGDEGIVVEHRATDIALAVAKDLEGLVSEQRPRTRGLVAVGGALSGDPYLLAPMFAGVSLGEIGFHATNLGPESPPHVLEHAAQRLGARLVWVSVSVPPPPALLNDLRHLSERLAAREIALAVGGRHGDATQLTPRPNLATGKTLAELVAFGRTIVPAPTPPPAVTR
ncbi:MAG: helix-turn-helix domain-containing protein [Myxococcota bacterium]